MNGFLNALNFAGSISSTVSYPLIAVPLLAILAAAKMGLRDHGGCGIEFSGTGL
jgi:hypothetical protein